jgi:hypothetical protein
MAATVVQPGVAVFAAEVLTNRARSYRMRTTGWS